MTRTAAISAVNGTSGFYIAGVYVPSAEIVLVSVPAGMIASAAVATGIAGEVAVLNQVALAHQATGLLPGELPPVSAASGALSAVLNLYALNLLNRTYGLFLRRLR